MVSTGTQFTHRLANNAPLGDLSDLELINSFGPCMRTRRFTASARCQVPTLFMPCFIGPILHASQNKRPEIKLILFTKREICAGSAESEHVCIKISPHTWTSDTVVTMFDHLPLKTAACKWITTDVQLSCDRCCAHDCRSARCNRMTTGHVARLASFAIAI